MPVLHSNDITAEVRQLGLVRFIWGFLELVGLLAASAAIVGCMYVLER